MEAVNNAASVLPLQQVPHYESAVVSDCAAHQLPAQFSQLNLGEASDDVRKGIVVYRRPGSTAAPVRQRVGRLLAHLQRAYLDIRVALFTIRARE